MSYTTLDTDIAYTGPDPSEIKWSPGKTLRIVTGSSLALWGLIIVGLAQLT